MAIPDSLIDQVRSGQAVLFVGAGASLAAVDGNGNRPPTGAELASRLSMRFLGGKHKDSQLSIVSELAISDNDLTTVQEYIRTLFEVYGPGQCHLVLPTFRWRAIATTNYDLIMERAYQACDKPQQTLVPFVKNGDRVDDKLSKPDHLMYLKLHGCITKTTDPQIPLILTPDQYVLYKEGRQRLFSNLLELAYEHTIIFIGSSLQDPDLRQILLELSGLSQSRPRYYTVTPSLSEAEMRFWESKRISPVKLTIEQFVAELAEAIPIHARALVAAIQTRDLPVAQRFAVSHPVVSESLKRFLTHDADYVHPGMSITSISPKQFYRGVNDGWSAIDQRLDVPRGLTDTILSDFILPDEAQRRSLVELVVIKAHAGAGKSVCLRRVAWDAAHDYSKICLFLRSHGHLNYEAIDELYQQTISAINGCRAM